MRLLHAVLLASLALYSVFGQTYTISTFAGGALPVNIPGTSASLGFGVPQYIAADPAGHVFFVDQNTVLRLDAATGILTLVAGNGTTGFSGDNGPATSAQLYVPGGVAVDSAGNLYIADTFNQRIRKVSNGVISTVAGNGTPGFSGDNGPATSAQLNSPLGVAVDSAGNLYIADQTNNRIRKVSNGVITTVAGNGTPGFSGDNGPATSAQLSFPAGIAVDPAGTLYIADGGNYRIRKVSGGVITTVAGNGIYGDSGDNGPATSAQLKGPVSVAVDAAGNLYIVDSYSCRIRKVSNGVITTLAGNGTQGFSGDNGPASGAQLYFPEGVAVDAAANLYIADYYNHRIRKVSNGVITTVAGGGMRLGDSGAPTSAQLNRPNGVAVDSTGNLYIADSLNNRIRKVSNGVITTVAGNGSPGFGGDNGLATNAQLNDPLGVAVDSAGNLYIADTNNYRIRKVTNGVITTVAGNGTPDFSGDNGPATSAQLNSPLGVAVDSAGDLYVADRDNNRIRKISNGVISTVAGNGTPGFSGDNGPATSAQLNDPYGVAVDSTGNLYIADSLNNRIRKVSNGVITTVAGNGTQGFSGDNGPATSAQLYGPPSGVAVDSAGNLYIADSNNERIRKVSNGVITTVAGNGGQAGFSGDYGPATSAQLYVPTGVAVDSPGDLYIADAYNNRIRVLTPVGSPCTYSVSPTTLPAPASGGNLTVSIQTTASCAWAVSGLPSWITVSGASSGTGSATVTLVVAPNSGAAQSATISIAGVSVMVTQAAPCTYAISPGGQSFAATGGPGTINITAGAGCPWTAASTASWITITGVGTGSGNGSVTFQAVANTGAARSGSIAVAGLSFTVEEAAASITGLASAGSMAQLASAGYWTTTITLVNTGSSPAQARLNFFDDNGNPLALPLTFPSSSSGGAIPLVILLASTLDRTVNPGAKLVIQTTGPNSSPTLVGWAQLLTNGAIGGFAVFSQAIGNANQEAEVPLENRNAGGYVVPFDNTNGAATGIALANISAQAANTTVTIRDDTGAVILTDTLTLPAMGHTSFNLTDRYASITAQRSGTLEFRTPTAGQISVLGLRFNSTGAFTTIPAIAK